MVRRDTAVRNFFIENGVFCKCCTVVILNSCQIRSIWVSRWEQWTNPAPHYNLNRYSVRVKNVQVLQIFPRRIWSHTLPNDLYNIQHHCHCDRYLRIMASNCTWQSWRAHWWNWIIPTPQDSVSETTCPLDNDFHTWSTRLANWWCQHFR